MFFSSSCFMVVAACIVPSSTSACNYNHGLRSLGTNSAFILQVLPIITTATLRVSSWRTTVHTTHINDITVNDKMMLTILLLMP